MRKLTYYVGLSIDGYIRAALGSGEPLATVLEHHRTL